VPPRTAKVPPSGASWIHEIKHDGFRILARKDGDQISHDFADRYRLIVDAIASLPVDSCIIDGEAIVVDQSGLSISTPALWRVQWAVLAFAWLVACRSRVRSAD
jgi:ATP-dependent DNA ligase